MRKIKYLILFLFLIPIGVSADCNNAELIRYKKLAGNVTYSVESIKGEDGEETGTFNIKFTNLIEGLYVSNSFQYRDYKPNNGIATVSGYYGGVNNHFAIRNSKCPRVNLITMDIKLPIYNSYYKEEVCKNYQTIPVCQKWVTSPVDEEAIQNYIDKNTIKKEEVINKKDVKGIFDYVLDYYVKYYYIAIPITIVILVLIILIYKIYKRKKESLF